MVPAALAGTVRERVLGEGVGREEWADEARHGVEGFLSRGHKMARSRGLGLVITIGSGLVTFFSDPTSMLS